MHVELESLRLTSLSTVSSFSSKFWVLAETQFCMIEPQTFQGSWNTIFEWMRINLTTFLLTLALSVGALPCTFETFGFCTSVRVELGQFPKPSQGEGAQSISSKEPS